MWDMKTEARSVVAASPIYPYEGTLDGVIRASTVSQRFMATLLLVFGVVALVMAMVGIFGVVSYQ